MLEDIKRNNEQVKPNSKELEVLKSNFPACFNKEGSFDIEKFKKEISSSVDITEENYGLNFLGKSYAKLVSALDTETVIEPNIKHNSLAKNKESKNMYITGDNLDVLKHLSKSYAGKIDVIYIDPPYNTGNDGFVYNDRFKYTAQDLVEKLNISEDRANKILDFTSKGSASHSAWLAFMYPRLYIARDLLADDGVIFISIDDNEFSQLKLLCDDVFGEENFLGNIIQNKCNSQPDANNIQKNHEYILVYIKQILSKTGADKKILSSVDTSLKEAFFDGTNYYIIGSPIVSGQSDSDLNHHSLCGYTIYYNKKNGSIIPKMDYDTDLAKVCNDENKVYKPLDMELIQNGYVGIRPNKKGSKLGRWTWSFDKFINEIDSIVIKHTSKNTYSVCKKIIVDESNIVKKEERFFCEYENRVGSKSILNFPTSNGTSTLKELLSEVVFNNPKNINMIKYLLNLYNDKYITVLDFFSGSATTAQAVMELNVEDDGDRKFILVQLPEAVDSTEYKTIDEIGRKRIELSAEKIKKEHPEYTGDLGFKHYTVKTVDADTVARMEEFDPEKEIVNMSDVITTDTILTTWMCADGYGINLDVSKIDLDGYSAYVCGNHLYLIDAGFSEQSIGALTKRLMEDEAFNIKFVVLFGDNFNDWSINEMLEKNLKVLKNTNKALNIDIMTRF